MIANQLPELDKEDAKYSSFNYMLKKEPKDYNLIIEYPEETISKKELFDYLNNGFRF